MNATDASATKHVVFVANCALVVLMLAGSSFLVQVE